jgi:DUF4097 and DUF4098 domain-containing protein YvlB
MRIRALQLALLGCAALFAAEPQLHREGGFWVEVEKGSERVAPHGNVRITSIGRVSVEGAAGNELIYTLVKRVKARNEAEARRLMSGYRFRSVQSGGLTRLWVVGGPEMADLEVTAPRNCSALAIETRGGAVNVAQLAGTLKVETGGGRIVVDQIAGDVVARTVGGDITLGKLGGDARCVSGGGPIRAQSIHGQAILETAGGDITVQQVDGPVHCSTAGGGIHIVQAGDIVIADTAGGPIDVGHAQGMVTAKNSGGPIQVSSASGARCESASGAIRLLGGSLKASTAVGSIIARFQIQPVEDSFLSTGKGDITVWIPSNLKVTVRAQNAGYGGPKRIVSDFPDIAVKITGAATIAEGTLNGGGPLVRLAGTGGVIFIRREEK